jgi:hypothetical protein
MFFHKVIPYENGMLISAIYGPNPNRLNDSGVGVIYNYKK